SSNGNGSNINIHIPGFITVTMNFTYPYVNQIQSVALNGPPTSGTFTLTYGGNTTSAIPYNASAPAVQSAQQALPSIGSGNVPVSGPNGGPDVMTFGGTMTTSTIGSITSSSSLSGGTSPAISIAATETDSSKAGTASQQSDYTCPATWFVMVTDTTTPASNS